MRKGRNAGGPSFDEMRLPSQLHVSVDKDDAALGAHEDVFLWCPRLGGARGETRRAQRRAINALVSAQRTVLVARYQCVRGDDEDIYGGRGESP